MNIITVTAEPTDMRYPRKFYIDCPIDVEVCGSEIRRIEIPRELALYITSLKEANKELKRKLEALGDSDEQARI